LDGGSNADAPDRTDANGLEHVDADHPPLVRDEEAAGSDSATPTSSEAISTKADGLSGSLIS
jgi:hypothetical protein